MASNISVAITVDNKQYIAGVQAADNATKKFATDTERSLNKISGSFDGFTRRVGGLRTALAGLAFGAVGKGALGFADNLQDLANSSGIAVARLLEFQNALATSGGQADQMPQAINTLLRSIDEAAGGSIKAQNSFMRLGVSLKDLGTLSEEDLLKETLKGIAAIESPSRRAAEMMDKFGKSFKTVDPQELLDKLNASAGSADKYAQSIKRAAELNDKFVEVTNNLKLAFLEAFSGPIAKLLEFNTKTAEGATKVENLVTIVKALAIALAAAFAISGITAFVAIIGQIGRAFTVVLGVSKGLAGVFAAGGSLMVAIRGIAVAFTAFVVVVEGAQALFEPFSDRSVVAIMKIVEALGMLAAAMAGGAFGAAAGTAIGGPLGGIIGGVAGATAAMAGMKLLTDKAAETRKELETKLAIPAPTAAASPEGKKDPTTGRPVDTSERAKAIASVKEITAEFEKQARLNNAKLDFQTRMVDKTEEEKQIAEASRNLFLDYNNSFDQLQKRRLSLGKDELYLVKEIENEQDALSQLFLKQDGELVNTLTALQTAVMLEKNRKQELENIITLMEQISQAQEDIANFQGQQSQAKEAAFEQLDAQKQSFDLLTRREQLERGLLNMREQDKTAAMALFELENDRKTQLEAIQKIQNLPFEGVGGMQQRLQEVNDLYDARLVKIKETQAQTTAEQESFSFGWAQATEKYRNSITTNAEYATKQMTNFTKGIEDVFVKFVQTGKLSFKDLANSMIAEFARIQAQKLLTSAMGGGGGGGFFGKILGSIFGGITGGGGGGAMANGGQVQGNTPYVIGERGPELFVPQNAGKIVPNHALGGGGSNTVNNTAVSYNISAVDAQSFKSMLARDPEFIHNVAEQGRRSMPIRSRR